MGSKIIYKLLEPMSRQFWDSAHEAVLASTSIKRRIFLRRAEKPMTSTSISFSNMAAIY